MFSQNDKFSQKSGENQRNKISRWYPLAPFTVNWLSSAMKYTYTDMCAQTDYDTSLYDHNVLLIILSIMRIVVMFECPRRGVTDAEIF